MTTLQYGVKASLSVSVREKHSLLMVTHILLMFQAASRRPSRGLNRILRP